MQSLADSLAEGFVFVNLVDTDMLYGHRNNAKGYAAALEEIDVALPRILAKLREDDVFIITADHGCDPTTESTDHSREYVPLLISGKRINPIDLGTLNGFDHIAKFVCALFGVGTDANIFQKIMRR